MKASSRTSSQLKPCAAVSAYCSPRSFVGPFEFLAVSPKTQRGVSTYLGWRTRMDLHACWAAYDRIGAGHQRGCPEFLMALLHQTQRNHAAVIHSSTVTFIGLFHLRQTSFLCTLPMQQRRQTKYTNQQGRKTQGKSLSSRNGFIDQEGR